MKSISVLMTANDAKECITEAVDSLLKQSFADFELIIVKTGSSDGILSAISSWKDKRIKVIDSEMEGVLSLNVGMETAKGKYIARMDANDIAHVNRLKVQYSLMEAFPEMTVCGSWIHAFGEKAAPRTIKQNYSGFVENPLLQLLQRDFVYGGSAMIRNDFVEAHHLRYANCPGAEDYQFWVESAKAEAVFYIESQPLVFKRMNDAPNTEEHQEKQKQSVSGIKKEIIAALCARYEKYPALKTLTDSFYELSDNQWISEEEMIKIVHTIITKNRDK